MVNVIGLGLFLLAQSQDARPTAMGQLAASMKPGAWAELKTGNMIETFRQRGASGAINGYAEGGTWDPKTRRFFFVGGDHNDLAIFVSYSADENAWKILPSPPWMGKSTMHGYDHNAIDAAAGIFYHYGATGARTIRKYDIAADTWTALPKSGQIGTDYLGLAYFPEMGGLALADGGGGNIHFFNEKTQQWSTIAKGLAMGPYHNFAEYNPVHKVVIMGGGNNDSRDFYKLDASGKLTTPKKAEVPLGVKHYSIVTVDPVGGDYLVFTGDGQFYVYNVVADTWKKQEGEVPVFKPTRDNKIWHLIATPVSTYGVVMFAKYYASDPPQSWVYLYKHSAKKPAK